MPKDEEDTLRQIGPGGGGGEVSISEIAEEVEEEVPKLEKGFKEIIQKIREKEGEEPSAMSHIEFDVDVPVTKDFRDTLSEILDAKLYNYKVWKRKIS